MQENGSGKPLRILTIDLEEWFHILDLEYFENTRIWPDFEPRIHLNTLRILEFLEKNNLKATFFVLGWVAEKYPELVRLISAKGHEIGSHSLNHLLIYKTTPQQFREDLRKSLDVLQGLLGTRVRAFRAPGFSIKEGTLWAFEVLAEEGIEVDSSVFPGPRGHGGMKSLHVDQPFRIRVGERVLREFPVSMFRIGKFRLPFSGGGYFRLTPFTVLDYLVRRSSYLMTYFHARDFDQSQPVIGGLPWIRKFCCYYGLKGSFEKFKKVVKKYDFVDLRTAESSVDWNSVPELDIQQDREDGHKRSFHYEFSREEVASSS